MTLTREWFQAGFEADAGIINARWQLKAREHGYITEWSNPSSDFWDQEPESPCAAGSTNPAAKYSALKRIDLMTVIRGPGNQLCATPPAANETISLPPELDAALAAVAAKHPGLVFVVPKFEAPNCAAFRRRPHLTIPGNTTVAKAIAAYCARAHHPQTCCSARCSLRARLRLRAGSARPPARPGGGGRKWRTTHGIKQKPHELVFSRLA